MFAGPAEIFPWTPQTEQQAMAEPSREGGTMHDRMSTVTPRRNVAQQTQPRPQRSEAGPGSTNEQLADPRTGTDLVVDHPSGVTFRPSPVEVLNRIADTGAGVADFEQPDEQVGVVAGQDSPRAGAE